MPRCQFHNKELVEGKWGPYCPTRKEDGHYCKGVSSPNQGNANGYKSKDESIKDMFEQKQSGILRSVAFQSAVDMVKNTRASGETDAQSLARVRFFFNEWYKDLRNIDSLNDALGV